MNETEFITLWLQKLKTEKLKEFPKDYLSDENTQDYSFGSKALIIGREFFGEYELLDTEGKEIIRVESLEKAKYFLYANRARPEKISIPTENSSIAKLVSSYEKYLDSLVKKIHTDFNQKFGSNKNASVVVSQIFKHLNLIRL